MVLRVVAPPRGPLGQSEYICKLVTSRVDGLIVKSYGDTTESWFVPRGADVRYLKGGTWHRFPTQPEEMVMLLLQFSEKAPTM